jgi:hypothetical protein
VALMIRNRLKLNSITNDLLTLDGVLLMVSHSNLQTSFEALRKEIICQTNPQLVNSKKCGLAK